MALARSLLGPEPKVAPQIKVDRGLRSEVLTMGSGGPGPRALGGPLRFRGEAFRLVPERKLQGWGLHLGFPQKMIGFLQLIRCVFLKREFMISPISPIYSI